MIYRIGVLDDEFEKATLICAALSSDSAQVSSKDNSAVVELLPVEIEVKRNIEDTISSIAQSQLDAILIDYKLSARKTAAYNGVDVANRLIQSKEQFPIFILTSFEDDLFQHEVFNAYQVYDCERYLNDSKEMNELHKKIVQQIIKVVKETQQWADELCRLIQERGKNAAVDSRILELDSKLERSLSTKHALPEKTKKDLSASSFQELIDKIDELLRRHS